MLVVTVCNCIFGVVMETTSQMVIAPGSWGEVTTLTVKETELAKGLLLKNPEVKQELSNLANAMAMAIESYRGLCLALRDAKWNTRERTLVLRHAGFNKVRVSEINTIVEAPQKVFDAYQTKMLGFRLALAETRAASGGGSFAEHGDKVVTGELKAYLQKYTGHVPVKGRAVVQFVKGDIAFKLTVRKVRKVKKGKV